MTKPPNAQSISIKPGQQSKVDNNGLIKLTSDVAVDEVMAWKNGRFQFNEVLMRL